MKVEEARALEMKRMVEFGVFAIRKRADAVSGKRVRARWVDTLKGDLVRSRLVAMEFRAEDRPGNFTATPSLKAIRLVIEKCASMGRKRLLARYDASVAFFHADIDELIFVFPPVGLCGADECWELCKASYGTRRASFLWAAYVEASLESEGWKRLIVAPNLYFLEDEDMLLVIHGDDVLTEGEPEQLDKTDGMMERHFLVKILPRIGPGGVSEGQFLHRIISWCEKGFEYEGDPKHIKLLAEDLELTEASAADTPVSKATGTNDPRALEPLPAREVKVFQQNAGRVLYVSLDRLEIQFACKVVMADMSKPFF